MVSKWFCRFCNRELTSWIARCCSCYSKR